MYAKYKPLFLAIVSLAVVLLLVGSLTRLGVIGAPRPLTLGDTGEQVREVQVRLSELGYPVGVQDGVFGDETFQAVLDFQIDNGLRPDGVVRQDTLTAMGLNRKTDGTVIPAQAYDTGQSYNDDLYLLARAIHGEARGEPYIGKVAVGAVILNRTRDPRFPHTVYGVIFEAGAFDAVYDGQFWLEPDEESLRAAADALNGWDPTGGAVYYWNPATATSGWVWSRTIIATIGNHVFAI